MLLAYSNKSPRLILIENCWGL